MSPRAWLSAAVLIPLTWAPIIWFVTTDTAARMWAGFLGTWPVWLFIVGGAVIAAFLAWANEPHEPQPETDPAKLADARAEFAVEAFDTAHLCNARHSLLLCDRAAGHRGLHANTTVKGRVISWPNLAEGGAA